MRCDGLLSSPRQREPQSATGPGRVTSVAASEERPCTGSFAARRRRRATFFFPQRNSDSPAHLTGRSPDLPSLPWQPTCRAYRFEGMHACRKVDRYANLPRAGRGGASVGIDTLPSPSSLAQAFELSGPAVPARLGCWRARGGHVCRLGHSEGGIRQTCGPGQPSRGGPAALRIGAPIPPGTGVPSLGMSAPTQIGRSCGLRTEQITNSVDSIERASAAQ